MLNTGGILELNDSNYLRLLSIACLCLASPLNCTHSRPRVATLM